MQDLLTQEQEFEGPIAQQRRELQELADQEERISRRLSSLTDWKSVSARLVCCLDGEKRSSFGGLGCRLFATT
jgi:hypothetical protein